MSATIIDFRQPPLIAAEEKEEIATLLGQMMRAICDEKLEDAEEDAEELVHRLYAFGRWGREVTDERENHQPARARLQARPGRRFQNHRQCERSRLAKMSLNGIDAHRRRRDMSPKAAPGIANGLMIAALALLTILGVPRSDLERL
jgi:hypothetical protein